MSLLKVNDIQTALGSPNRGKILQVVQATKTDTFTTSSTSWTDLTGLSVSITPSSTTNKIIIQLSLCFIGDSNTQGYARLVRDSTPIAIGDANGSRVRFTLNNYILQTNEVRTSSIMFLDSPGTNSSITYKTQLQTQGTGTVYVNRSTTWSDNQTSGTGISSLILMEVSS